MRGYVSTTEKFRTLLENVRLGFRGRFRFQLVLHDLFPVFATLPTLVFYLVDPRMFELDWVGYAVFSYATFFVVFSWLVLRLRAKPTNRISWLGVFLCVGAILLYQFLLYGLGLSSSILGVGEALGLEGWWLNQNWRVSIDLLAFSVFLTALTVAFFGLGAVRKFVPAIAYSLLTVVAFLIDAFYPSSSFFAFQVFVPYIVVAAAGLLSIAGLNPQYSFITDSRGDLRSIMVVSQPRFLAIDVNWACAGILSMLIYFAVIYGLLQTVSMPRLRKTVYLTLGFLGTVFVNILRIVALVVFYVYLNADFLVFHQYVGGLFFVTWISLFLTSTFLVEKRRRHIASGPADYRFVQ